MSNYANIICYFLNEHIVNGWRQKNLMCNIILGPYITVGLNVNVNRTIKEKTESFAAHDCTTVICIFVPIFNNKDKIIL